MSIEVRTSVNKNDFNGDGKSDILWRHDTDRWRRGAR